MATKAQAVRGSRHPSAVLTEKDVVDIRRRTARRGVAPIAAGAKGGPAFDIPISTMAKLKKVSTQALHLVITGQSWTHVPMPKVPKPSQRSKKGTRARGKSGLERPPHKTGGRRKRGVGRVSRRKA